MNGLMLHCGAEAITRSQVAMIPTPPADGPRHHPVPYADFIDLTTDALRHVGLQIVNEQYGALKDGGRFFGLMEVKPAVPTQDEFGLVVGLVLAALLGAVTPFCSCSSVPLFIGFVEAGIPLGITFSFLIASPMINEVAVIILAGILGWKLAALYVLAGLVVATGVAVRTVETLDNTLEAVFTHVTEAGARRL